MDKDTLKQQAINYLKSQPLGIIATVAPNNTPESACVNFLIEDDWTIDILTNKDSRKVQNIIQNPHVSFVVGVATIPNTAQIQADAVIIDEANPAFEQLSQKLKDAKVLLKDPMYSIYGDNYVILKLTITWFRWLYFDGQTGKEVYTVLIP